MNRLGDAKRRGVEGSCLRRLAVVAAALGLSFTGSAARGQAISPGKLSSAHAGLETECAACHSRDRVEPSLCLKCHSALRVRVRARKGYHARVDQVRCGKCHPEHHGREFPTTRWPTGGEKGFDHRLAGYPLSGSHKKAACRDCHKPANIKEPSVKRLPLPIRQRTYLGLWTECGSCHQDVHRGTLGAVCTSCHTETGFRPVTRFPEHSRTRFPLKGKHKSVPCAKCHRPAQGTWRFSGIPSATCADCHKTPHRASMGVKGGKATLACQKCHGETKWSAIDYNKDSHPATLPLKGGHGRAACKACHGAKASQTPKSTGCASCHKDIHGGKFGATCTKCHSVETWRVSRGQASGGTVLPEQKASADHLGIPAAKVKAVAFHSQTRYPLTGRHIVTSCDACHRRGKKRVYKKMKFGRCDDCHKDTHQGQFARHDTPNAELARRCEGCHDTLGWPLVRFTLAQHDQARFPLKAAHRGVPCASCHGAKRRPAERFTYESRECEACHRDPHKGNFRATPTEKLACRACHDERSFARSAFDHDKTKLPLRGAHAKTACASCHRPDASGRVLFRGLGAGCETCHADQHQGQFTLKEPKRLCRDCHGEGTQAFKVPRFDHERLTKFALAGAHRKVRCESCHHRVRLKDGHEVVYYRMENVTCRTCHKSRHLELEKRVRARTAPQAQVVLVAARTAVFKRSRTLLKKCEACHQPDGWRQLKSPEHFDHGLTGYPLRGRHAAAACATCHRPKQATARPCGSCHADPHLGRLGRGCAECHEQASWTPSPLLAQHRRTRLPLSGSHALADCASCHPGARESRFRGAPAACYACHAAAYNDPALHPNHAKVGFDRRCEQCHRTVSWRPAIFGSRAALATSHQRFPLTGRHAQLACNQCHDTSRPTSSCVSCHAAALASAKSPDHRAAGFSTDCARCHGTQSFRPAVASAHAGRFPLTGKHRGIACADCHTEPSNYRATSCTGACHVQGEMDPKHRRMAGYVFETRACLRCHPAGRK